MHAVRSFGIKLGQRIGDTYSYTLYSLNDFYVEVRLHTEQGSIEGLEPFLTSLLLEPYLSSIDISELIPSA